MEGGLLIGCSLYALIEPNSSQAIVTHVKHKKINMCTFGHNQMEMKCPLEISPARH
jgi:hypothetical protein